MSFVTREVKGRVGYIRLSRPEAMNAISGEVADALAAAFREVSGDSEAWVVVLGAEGEKAFCVGADLKERNRLDDDGWMRNREKVRGMFDALRDVEQPVIASVFGYALGGGFELALNCDLIVASEDALFGLPEVTVGIVPGGGGTQQLPRKVGMARAMELILTGRRISAAEALDIGLVNRVVPRDELEAATGALASELCSASPRAARLAKDAARRGVNVPLPHGIEIEDWAWRRAVETEDRREGIAAFNEKRRPEWKNR